MAKIIVTSRYLKSGKREKTKRRNYTKYIATRESVEKRPQIKAATTEKQEQLITELVKEFPMATKYLEYSDYISKPTAENASELISTIIERHADVIGNRKNFVGYMAKRPGAERRGEHGLFNGSDTPIDLNAVANEVAEHPGYVWTHVISLRREDAIRLGYTNSDMWRDLVMRHISDISKAQKIPLAEMKWYAAFHDTTHHPHIHLIVYSQDPRQGYLTKDGIDKIRSVFANDIFHDELQSIYQEQTLTRDELKALSEDQMSDIVSRLGSSQVDERLVVKVHELYDILQSTKGKKVYGYLPKGVKQIVDDIFLLLSQNENIQKLYDKWCEFEKAKYRMYTQKDKDFPDLVENKEFRSVKNMIIREVLKADILPKENEIPDEIPVEEESIPFDINEGTATAVKKRMQAQELTNKTNAVTDMKKGIEILDRLAKDGDELSMYKLAKLLLDDNEYHDTAKAVELLEAVADKNMWASYRLGRIYLFGSENVESDKTKAVLWLTKSAEAGNEYAEKLLNYSNGEYSGVISNTVVSLLVDLGRFIEEDNARHRRNISTKVDKKLQRMIQKKKQELGIKSDSIDMSYNY